MIPFIGRARRNQIIQTVEPLPPVNPPSPTLPDASPQPQPPPIADVGPVAPVDSRPVAPTATPSPPRPVRPRPAPTPRSQPSPPAAVLPRPSDATEPLGPPTRTVDVFGPEVRDRPAPVAPTTPRPATPPVVGPSLATAKPPAVDRVVPQPPIAQPPSTPLPATILRPIARPPVTRPLPVPNRPTPLGPPTRSVDIVGPTRVAPTPQPTAPITSLPVSPVTLLPQSSSDELTGLSPEAAAHQLRAYLLQPTANFGTKDSRSNEVRVCQRALGVTADGIVGPNTRAACSRFGVSLPMRRAPGVITTGTVTQQPSAPAVFPPASLTSATTPSGHVCAGKPPAHLKPQFDAITDVAAWSKSPLLKRFATCPVGLLAVYKVESGMRWNPTPARNRPAPRDPTHRARWSYGIMQILDSSGPYLYSQRSIVGPFAAAVKPWPIPGPGYTDSPVASDVIRSFLADPMTQRWYNTIHLVKFDQRMTQAFDVPRLLSTGILVPREVNEHTERIAADYNARQKAQPGTDLLGWLYRMYVLASSIEGMANLVKFGTLDKGPWQRYLQRYGELMPEAVIPPPPPISSTGAV